MPAQIVVAVLAAIVNDTGTLVFTVIVMEFDVAGLPVTHVLLEVNSQVTTSLFTNASVVNVELFVPASVPFTFH